MRKVFTLDLDVKKIVYAISNCDHHSTQKNKKKQKKTSWTATEGVLCPPR